MQNSSSGRTGLIVIGAFKLVKALALVVVGIGVFKLVHHDVVEVLSRWIGAVHVDPDNRYFQKVMTKLLAVNDHKLKELGAGTFFYAGLFTTEGLGLVFEKTWAEYFTIFITSSFLPVEVYLMTQHFTVVRVLATLVNIGIVWYLVAYRLRERKRQAAMGLRSSMK
jgi:uncharacterized membrane protein (DUF2068 family)